MTLPPVRFSPPSFWASSSSSSSSLSFVSSLHNFTYSLISSQSLQTLQVSPTSHIACAPITFFELIASNPLCAKVDVYLQAHSPGCLFTSQHYSCAQASALISHYTDTSTTLFSFPTRTLGLLNWHLSNIQVTLKQQVINKLNLLKLCCSAYLHTIKIAKTFGIILISLHLKLSSSSSIKLEVITQFSILHNSILNNYVSNVFLPLALGLSFDLFKIDSHRLSKCPTQIIFSTNF